MLITEQLHAAIQQSAEDILGLWWIGDRTGLDAKKAVLELVIMKNLCGVKESE